MKAVVAHQYGGPQVLKFEDYSDPVAGPDELLVRVAATSRLEIRQENARVYGRSGARWQASNPD